MGQAVRCRFAGLVSIDTFNKANRGRLTIVENGEEIRIEEKKMETRVPKTKFNPLFPYKRVVSCPTCGALLFGSTTRGHTGKRYPAYHCDRWRSTVVNYKYHYFRVRKEKFDETIEEFIKLIEIKPKYEMQLIVTVLKLWEMRQAEYQRDDQVIALKVDELKLQAEMVAEKIKFLSSEVTIKYLEEDLLRIESQIKSFDDRQTGKDAQDNLSRGIITRRVKRYIKQPDILILRQPDPVQQANLFGLLFDRVPRYSELVGVIDDETLDIGLNQIFTVHKKEELDHLQAIS